MKKSIILIWIILLEAIVMTYGQTKITLNDCRSKAREKYPLIKQKLDINKARDKKIDSYNTVYYPQLSLNAQATYQSDVIEFPVKLPLVTFPVINKDSYKATLDLTQVIWDGGAVTGQKNLEQKSAQADEENIEVELYKINDNINKLYFSVLLLDKNISIVEIYINDLSTKLKVIESAIANGAMIATNADAIKVEILKLKQQKAELAESRMATIKTLSDYIESDIPAESVFELATTESNTAKINRPEYKYFDMQLEKLKAQSDLTDVKLMPKIAGFFQYGYGRPGLNMLKNDFTTFYIAGLKFSWTPWNWNQSGLESEAIMAVADMVKIQKETFDKNLTININRAMSEIKKYTEISSFDDEILSLKTRIAKASESQFLNGAMTSAEYLSDKNSELQALQNKELHCLQLLKAKEDLNNLTGNN